MVAFNCARGLTAKPFVRVAVARLADWDGAVRDAVGGKAVAAEYPVPPEDRLYEAGIAKASRDAQAAIATLESEHYRRKGERYYYRDTIDGRIFLSFGLLVDAQNAAHVAIARAAAAQLVEAGIEVEVEELPYEEMMARVAEGDFDMALTGYRAKPHPDMTELYSESWFSGTRDMNIARYENAEVDRLARELYIENDPLERQAAFADLAEELKADVPYIGLYFSAAVQVVRDGVRGVAAPSAWDPLGCVGDWYIPET
jgi:ABC-type transport system substrate-binding protein